MANAPLFQSAPQRRRTVGPHWSSVQPHAISTTTATSAPSPSDLPHGAIALMQQGVHSSFLNAISRPDLNPDYSNPIKPAATAAALNNSNTNAVSASVQQEHVSPKHVSSEHYRLNLRQQHPTAQDLPIAVSTSIGNHQGTSPFLLTEHQRQQQLYMQQLELMQRLHTIPGSTARPWYPTFGPAHTTTCSDSTILLLNSPQRFNQTSHAKLNKQSVGPHWRSVHSASASPMSSPPPSSPQFPSLSLTAKAVSGNDYEEYGLDRTAVMMSLGTTGSETTSAPSSPSSPCGSSLGSSPVSIISTTGASPDMDYSRRIFAQTQHSLDQQYSLQYTGIRQDLRASLKVEAENLMEEIPGTTNSPIQLRGSSYSQSTKRKATWQDDESLEHSDPPISTSSFLNEFAPDGSGKSMSLMQQSTRNTILGDHNGSFEHHYSTANFTELDYRPQDDTEPMILTPADSTYGQMSVDVSAANSVQDFGDDDVDEGAFMRSNLSLPKRSRSRLDTQAIHAGGLSEIEVRRQESGQRTLDIFQQCFYNAAAASW